MKNSLLAEGTKYFSTPGWALGGLALLFLGLMMPVGNTLNANLNGAPVTLATAMSGVDNIGLIVIMAIAATFVTQEYRYGIVKTSLLATPSRAQWLTAKAILMCVLAGLAALTLAVLSIAAVTILAAPGLNTDVTWAAAAPMVGRTALITAAMTLLAIAVGGLLRATPSAVTLIIAWPTIIELLISRLPGLSDIAPPYLLFSNVAYGIVGTDVALHFPWGPWGAVGYLTIVAGAAFLLTLTITTRRPLPN